MADGEIHTIAVIWKDLIRISERGDFGKGYSIINDSVEQNFFADNPTIFNTTSTKNSTGRSLKRYWGNNSDVMSLTR